MPGGDSRGDSLMNEISRILENQAKWQRQRAQLSWPEKIRMAENMRESIRFLRSGAPARRDDVVHRVDRFFDTQIVADAKE
jgi:hypothetical protein